jgi:hypothetical protein
MARYTALVVGLLLAGSAAAQDKKAPPAQIDDAKAIRAARDKGLDWLKKNQAKDGSWGRTYSIPVTSFACLAILSAADEPFAGDYGKALQKGLEFIMSNQKDGVWPQQGHTWIHGQGFATLALSETYGRSLLCKTKPDMDMKKVREAVAKSVETIAKHQSDSGGWWYTQNNKADHEGSTTCCAVQARKAASTTGSATAPT